MEAPNDPNGGSKHVKIHVMLVNVGQSWSMLVNGFSECRTFAPSEKIPGERAKRAALS